MNCKFIRQTTTHSVTGGPLCNEKCLIDYEITLNDYKMPLFVSLSTSSIFQLDSTQTGRWSADMWVHYIYVINFTSNYDVLFKMFS